MKYDLSIKSDLNTCIVWKTITIIMRLWFSSTMCFTSHIDYLFQVENSQMEEVPACPMVSQTGQPWCSRDMWTRSSNKRFWKQSPISLCILTEPFLITVNRIFALCGASGAWPRDSRWICRGLAKLQPLIGRNTN